MKILRLLLTAVLAMTLAVLPSCMKYGPSEEEEFNVDPSGEGLFIINEGNYMYGNASLSYYDPVTKHVENEVFVRSNGFKLGDVAQSMTMADGIGWASYSELIRRPSRRCAGSLASHLRDISG